MLDICGLAVVDAAHQSALQGFLAQQIARQVEDEFSFFVADRKSPLG